MEHVDHMDWLNAHYNKFSRLVAQQVVDYEKITQRWMINGSLQAIAAIGFGSYQANIIQFGIDQLHDASTEEIQTFIRWYVWSYVSGGMVIEIAALCIPKNYTFVNPLLNAVNLTVALTLSFVLDKILVKEPVNRNPFKLVYQVIKYGIKNKHPRCRSAFTYCEDELPSRLDLGKHKYGGPFTTEQVEDVKTFLWLVMIVFFGCSIPSAQLVANVLRDHLVSTLTDTISQVNTPSLQCYLHSFYVQAPFYSVVVLVPIHELITRPILHRYLSWIQCYWLFSFSAILQFVRLMLLMAYLLMARHNYIEQHHDMLNVTIQCIFSESYGTLSSSFDIRWIVPQGVLNSVSTFMLGSGGVEFICAQTPYSMRGLISGAGYGSVALFTLAGRAITKPFMMDLSIWKTGGIINCGFWYLLLVIVFFIFNGIILYILGRIYKNRKREDVLPNEQIFAERYYSQQ